MHDYDTSIAAKNDIEALIEINRRQVVMLQELQEILGKLDSGAAPVNISMPAKMIAALAQKS